MVNYHYVYMVIDPITNEYYIGSRTCKCEPNVDSYMGSYKTWKPIDATRLKKIIIKSDFFSRADSIIYESNLIKENINNELNRNYHIPTEGFCTLGNIEVAKKISKAKKGKPNKNKGKIGIYSIESLEKMRTAALNRKPITNVTRKKLSESLKGKMVGINNPMYGKTGNKNPNYGNKWTEEQKLLQSKKLKGKIKSEETLQKIRKPILQYDTIGNFVKEWDSLSQAANELKIYVGCINNCLKNRSKSSYGFVWKYKEINSI